jgi:hypothetical protein
LPGEAPLTPKAAERLSRELSLQSDDLAARALNIDWGTQLDGKQVKRWGDASGQMLVRRRDQEVLDWESGHHPPAPANDPVLLVVEVDGGRVQMREKNQQTGSRWREDKVATISAYLPGDGKERDPQPLVTTHVATMRRAEPFGRLVRLEAERRGLRQAEQVIALADAGNWTDPLFEREFGDLVRIVDWRHAQEHLWDSARAAVEAKPSARSEDQKAIAALEHRLETLLWNGKVKKVIEVLEEESARAGTPRETDGLDHPRRVLARDSGYFRKNQDHMNYPEYRRRGWPIGSGVVESGVKQFNKRVKGTEQFWTEKGLEPMLCLRGQWLSQDDRWNTYWTTRPAYQAA